MTGAYNKPKTDQLQAFINELNRKTHKKTPVPSNWTDAFELLREYIEGKDPEQKCVVFFDEMPWLDTHKSGFLSAFEYFWNDFGSSVDNLVSQIKQKIGILGVLSSESSWFVRADKMFGTAGAQIDLIIDRRDRVINLCEIKFSLSEYTIDKDYDETLRKRIETFRKNTKTKKAVQIVFVTTYGVESNQYSGIVQKQVTLDDLFKAKEI